LNLVLLGPPGAGKGTQAKKIQERYGLTHVSTGDLFRAALANQTALGRQVKKYLDSGQLVPDELTTAMVAERIAQPDCAGGVMFDGYPRTVGQAKALDGLLLKAGKKLDGVMYFDVTEETAIERLSGRRICKGCSAGYHVKYMPPAKPGVCDRCAGELYQRSDDKAETIRERLSVYGRQTEALIGEYRARRLLITVDANRAPDEVTAAVLKALEKLSGSGR